MISQTKIFFLAVVICILMLQSCSMVYRYYPIAQRAVIPDTPNTFNSSISATPIGLFSENKYQLNDKITFGINFQTKFNFSTDFISLGYLNFDQYLYGYTHGALGYVAHTRMLKSGRYRNIIFNYQNNYNWVLGKLEDQSNNSNRVVNSFSDKAFYHALGIGYGYARMIDDHSYLTFYSGLNFSLKSSHSYIIDDYKAIIFRHFNPSYLLLNYSLEYKTRGFRLFASGNINPRYILKFYAPPIQFFGLRINLIK